MKLRQTLVK